MAVFFKRCFLKTNFCTKYSHEKNETQTIFASVATKYGTAINQQQQIKKSTNYLQIIVFMDRFVCFSSKNLTFYRTSYKR